MRKIPVLVSVLGALGFSPGAFAFSIAGTAICEGDGSALEGLTVQATRGADVGTAVTDDTGAYLIRGPGQPLAEGTWNMSVDTPHPVSGPATVELTQTNAFLTGIDFVVDDPICRPPDVSIGDRVWEDLDGNGAQRCEDTNGDGIIGNDGDLGAECDAGVPNVTVDLFEGPDCTIPSGPSTTTDADGFYLFENLSPGDYCVRFDPTTIPADLCTVDIDGVPVNLGTPTLTTQDAAGAGDDKDSDADPTTGLTASINVPTGVNLTLDAGVVCPAKVGDFVFVDDNEDGVQQPGEPGVPDVEVELFACGPDRVAGTSDDIPTGEIRSTDANGRYMFGAEPGVLDLPPGEYFVVFNEGTYPPGFTSTTPMQGGDDALDSDCLPGGGTACVDVRLSGMVNLNRDCGLVPPPPPDCDVVVDLTCRVEPPPPPPGVFECDKPIDQLTMIWNGSVDVTVNAWKGDVGSELLASMAPAAVGAELTVNGYAGSPNDVIWEIFDAGTGAKLGESTFHLSCSDSGMNGPEDCGLPQGDGKDDDGFLNDWLLEGMIDVNAVLDCTADPSDPVFPTAQACQATLPPSPNCDTLDKPTSLVFEYTGEGCAASDNSQSGDKAECTTTDGGVSGQVTVLYAGGNSDLEKDAYMANPTLVSPGDTFEVTRGGDDFKSNSFIQISDGAGTELNEFHTSCSQPLATGDVFGSLRLVSFNGQSGGAAVTYGYTVTNNGDPLTGVVLTDIPLGDVAGPFDLAAGETRQFTQTATLLGSSSNTAIVTGSTADGGSCDASDLVTVELLPPPLSCEDGKPTRLVFEYVGDACSATTNDQEDKFECDGPALGALANVVMTKDESKIDVEIDGNTVTIIYTDDPGDSFPSEIEYLISDADGNEQSHTMHTSCSKALNVGDQFGALVLIEFVPED